MSIRAEKCQIHLKQKQFSNERFLKQTLLRPSTGLSGKLKTSSNRHLESLPDATKCTARKADHE